MPLSTQPDTDGCVSVRITADYEIDGCHVATIHGWAVSLPDSAILDRVFLVGHDNDSSAERFGPELSDEYSPDLQRTVAAQILWAKARLFTTSLALLDAFLDARDAQRGGRDDHARNMREEAVA
jgi:hypothetical protein